MMLCNQCGTPLYNHASGCVYTHADRVTTPLKSIDPYLDAALRDSFRRGAEAMKAYVANLVEIAANMDERGRSALLGISASIKALALPEYRE